MCIVGKKGQVVQKKNILAVRTFDVEWRIGIGYWTMGAPDF